MRVRYFSLAILMLGLVLTAGCGASSKEAHQASPSKLKFSFSNLLSELKANGLVSGRFLKVSSIIRSNESAPRGLRKATDIKIEKPYEHYYLWDEMFPVTFIEYPVEGSGTISVTFDILDEASSSLATLTTSAEFETSGSHTIQEISPQSIVAQSISTPTSTPSPPASSTLGATVVPSPLPSTPPILIDTDGDGVFDYRDHCPTEGSEGAGVDGQGCPIPDFDGDGVRDSDDLCQGRGRPGDVDAVGCPLPPPDADGDGVWDSSDQCPNEPGTWEFRGCTGVEPDFDMDGIFDIRDHCPTTGDQGFGIDRNGCPYLDSDGDGISDDWDACPAEGNRGHGVDQVGCPYRDADGDGYSDIHDSCPAVGDLGYGVNGFGCPNPIPSALDSDGDGILDTMDHCPSISGDVANFGCPPQPVVTPTPLPDDRDGDGFLDVVDVCPTLGGIVDATGCPVPSALDSDRDGVLDSNDHCPNTTFEPGFIIDANGCLVWPGGGNEIVDF